MGKRKFNLESAGNQTVFILGIASHETDYRLAWILNQGLGWKLFQGTPFKNLFPCFCYQDDQEITYTLILNRTPEKVLLEDWKSTDFMLVISGETSDHQRNALIEKVKSLRDVLTAFEIPLSRKIQNLGIF